jgi:hypothetical protein
MRKSFDPRNAAQIEHALFSILFDPHERTSLLHSIANANVAHYVAELAARNDVDQTLARLVADNAPLLCSQFPTAADDGGIVGYENARTSELLRETVDIFSEIQRQSIRVAVVKGAAISSYYPTSISRQQNDIDLAVPDFTEFGALFDVMMKRGYQPSVLAGRGGINDELEGSLSMVRVDHDLKKTFWIDILIGVQPISYESAAVLSDEFWNSLGRSPSGIPAPTPSQCLQILSAEIKERQSLRYKDMFDVLALTAHGALWDSGTKDSFGKILEMMGALLHRHRARLVTAFGLPDTCAAFRKTADRTVADEIWPIKLGTAPLRPQLSFPNAVQALYSGYFLRFVPCQGAAGSLSIACHLARIIIRTPVGCFASEDLLLQGG